MAAKSVDPTANPFELLANAENQTIVGAPERRKKTANKPAAEEPVGAAQPTPAAKAQARAAKEAAKATKQSDAPGDNQGKQEPAKKKLTREQFEEAKRQGTNLIGEAPASSDVSASTARPPRARGEGGVAGRGRGGGRGRGEGRGRGRGEGQGRGNGEKPGGRGDKDKDHHYQPPAHGREYDKKSAAKTSKNAPFKKGGSGGGGNYGTAQDDLAGQTGADTNVDAPTDDNESKTNEKKDKKKYSKGGDDEEESEEFKGTTFEEYLRTTKAAADAELLAKISTSSQAPRKVEGNLAGAVTKVDEEKKEEKKEKPKVEEKPTAKKTVALDDIFHVRTPPIRGRGRGRGRGGRGGGRGGKGGDNEEGEAAEEGTEQPTGQQTEQADQSAAQPQQVQGGSRGGKGGRGRGRGEGGRGQGRGGRGQGRGEGSNGRGQGRGGKGQRRPNLDSSNSRHFPDLGTSN